MSDTLHPGERLNAGEFLKSKDGRWMLKLQAEDGNLVRYGPIGSQYYHGKGISNTAGKGDKNCYLVNQTDDGNIVLYQPLPGGGRTDLWKTQELRLGMILRMQNDGNVTIYYPDPNTGKLTWGGWHSGPWHEPVAPVDNRELFCCTVSRGPDDNFPFQQTIRARNRAEAIRICYRIGEQHVGWGATAQVGKGDCFE